jgi:hypothetical protein
MHHCDWVATIVEGAAKSKLLPDGDGTPMDSINMWDSLMDPKELSESPRKDVVMNIDPTNQGAVENDPGGWSGASDISKIVPIIGDCCCHVLSKRCE